MWIRENQAIIAAIIMTAPTWALLVYNVWLARRNHGLLNSVMHERLDEQQRLGHAEGVIEGSDKERGKEP